MKVTEMTAPDDDSTRQRRKIRRMAILLGLLAVAWYFVFILLRL